MDGGSPQRLELAVHWAGSPERGAPVTEGWGPWRGGVCWGMEEGLREATVTVADLPGHWKQQDALECAVRSLAGCRGGGGGGGAAAGVSEEGRQEPPRREQREPVGRPVGKPREPPRLWRFPWRRQAGGPGLGHLGGSLGTELHLTRPLGSEAG